jgi:hypothetical protein
MTKQKLVRAVTAIALGLTMVTGVGAASALKTTHHESGPNNVVKTTVSNDNDVKVKNNNTQTATTGHAEVEHNKDDAGSAMTGAASNKNTLGATVVIDNSGACACATAAATTTSTDEQTGSVKVTTKITNDSDVKVTNNNTQTAKSGNAEVSNNKSAGDAKTGAASNDNSGVISVTITN